MNKVSHFIRKIEYSSIFLIPLFFLLVCIFRKSNMVPYYMISIDPEYAYLFNGLTLAEFKTHLGHLDHPGTPLQVLIALIIHLVYFFSGSGGLIEDVFANPTKYLETASYTIIAINTAALYIAGRFVFRTTGNVFASCFIQVAPFSAVILPTLFERVIPDTLFIASVSIIIAASMYFVKNSDNSKTLKQQFRYIFVFSLISAVAVSVKINFAPLIFIFFALLRDWKARSVFVAMSSVLFFIVSFPVLFQIVKFYRWVRDLILNEGIYGKGSRSIVNPDTYLPNLKQIFYDNPFFTVALIISIFTLVLVYVSKQNKNKRIAIYCRLLTGISAVMLVQTLIVAKHYFPRYIIPALLLSTFAVFVSLQTLVLLSNGKLRQWWVNLIFTALALYFFPVNVMASFTNKRHEKMVAMLQTQKQITDKLNQKPSLISPDYYGCSHKAYSLFYGKGWSGRIGKKFEKILLNMYPEMYFHSRWKNAMYNWQQNYEYRFLSENYAEMYVFFGSKDKRIRQEIQSKLLAYNTENEEVSKLKLVYENQITGESLYLLTNDTAKIKATQPVIVFDKLFCGAEKRIDGGKNFLTNVPGVQLSNASAQSNENVFEGQYSIKLTTDSPFGFTFVFPDAKKGDSFRVSAWRYSETQKGVIVASSDGSSGFYVSGSTFVQEENGWQKIEVKFTLDNILPDNKLKIYLLNNGEAEIFFDNLTFEKIKPKE